MILQHCERSSGSAEVKSNSPGRKCQQKDTSFVQLEIQVGELRRLITSNNLVIEDFHCLNNQSKSLIRQVLLDSLASPNS